MRQVTLIVGLPGSGKTHLAETEYVPKGYTLIDDPSSPNQLGMVLAAAPERVVVCDPNLCWPGRVDSARRLFTYLGWEVAEIVYFANDPEAAEANLRRRADNRGFINVRAFSEAYRVPEHVTPLPIYRPE